MEAVTFYTNPMSRGRIVHWMLEEVGAKYDVKILSFEKREHKDKKYLTINPMGKLPAIVHRGVTITETPAIIAYLADAFSKANLAPAVDSPERGAYYRWLFFSHGCFEPATIDKMLARPTVEKSMAVGWGTYDDTINTLEKAISSNQFILGDRFTAADLYVSSLIYFAMNLAKTLEPRPAFQQYLARCVDRPAYQRTTKQCDELLKQMDAKA